MAAKNSALNYSFLYSAKGFASLLGGGIAATLFEKTGTLELCVLRERGARAALGAHGAVCQEDSVAAKERAASA